MTPLISVVVPTRNRYSLLRSLLNAIAVQEAVPSHGIEVVVVVDGSEDETVAELQRWLPTFRLRVLSQARGGVAAARNRGWTEATSDLVLFLDDDVIPDRRLLAEHLAAHQGDRGLVVLGKVVQARQLSDAWSWYDGWMMRQKYAALEGRELPSGIHFGGNFSVRPDDLHQVGGFDSRLPRGEHVDLGFRLAEKGIRFCYAPGALVEHRGQRDLESWQTAYRLDGRMDVALYRDRSYAGGLATIVASYHDRHWLNRGLLRVALHRRSLERRLIGVAATTGIAAHRMRIRLITRLALSAAANLLYWGGVRDGLRGNRAFWQAIRETRSHTLRAYRLRGHET